MSFNMQIPLGYQQNRSSTSTFSYRTPTKSAVYNSNGPIQLQPHSSQLHPGQISKNITAAKVSNHPYSRIATYTASSSNHFKKFANNSVAPQASTSGIAQTGSKYKKFENNVKVAVNSATEQKARQVADARIYHGSVDKLIKWHKLLNSPHIMYITMGCLIQMRPGTHTDQRIMLFRSCKETGPVLQVVYYTKIDRIDITDFHIGQNLRCVGCMIGTNILRAFYIRNSTDAEIRTLFRMQAISERSVSKLATKYNG